MNHDLHSALQTVRAQVLDAETLVRATAGGRRKGTSPRWRRVELRPVNVKAGSRLQVVTFDDRQSFTRNEVWETASSTVDALLAEEFSHWHVVTTSGEFSMRIAKSGKVLTQQSSRASAQRTGHDRVKQRLVDPGEEFLRELGVTSVEGVVKPSRRDKYQQVEQFVGVLDVAVRDARAAGRLSRDRLRIVDLGCGNAYLTFATYRFLTQALGLGVELVGVDAKRQALEHNVGVAARLEFAQDVRFVESSILEAQVTQPVDIVLALHACDTATDEALVRAIEWRAELVLAAPCCHQDIQRQLRDGESPAGYSLVTRHGLLRERLGDVLTDALRAQLLRHHGYRTDVLEFVDSQHTPRNALLRAHRTGARASAEQEAEYETLVAQWGLRPRLAELLADRSAGP